MFKGKQNVESYWTQREQDEYVLMWENGFEQLTALYVVSTLLGIIEWYGFVTLTARFIFIVNASGV